MNGEIPALTNQPTWIIDPIDGTTNFIHSNPLTCVSIGLVVSKVPVLGVVLAPCCQELYVAVRGQARAPTSMASCCMCPVPALFGSLLS